MAIVHLTKGVFENKNKVWWVLQFKIEFKKKPWQDIARSFVPLDANTNAKELPKSAKMQQQIA